MRPTTWLAASAVLALAPATASAHLVSTGFGPVTDGLTHFALSPEEILPMAAFALFAGLRGPAHARWILFTLPAAWLATILIGIAPSSGLQPFLVAASFLLTGGLVAADVKLSPTRIALVAVLLGALCGAAYAGAAGGEDLPLLGLLGAAFGIFVLLALVSSTVLTVRSAWGLIAVRVLGSWTAAIGLLLVGWTLHGRS